MKFKFSISPKISYIASGVAAIVFAFYFAYKAIIAYLIHRELYGGGIDVLVALRCALSGVMFFLTLLFFQFMKIKDLKSQRIILWGVFTGWCSIFIILTIAVSESLYFIALTGVASVISLIASLGLKEKIKEEKNTLTEKEIYLLQKLANKK